jgi:predicted Ser/Thr protein kinase
MSLTVGETVGPYRIVEQLGQGGMATVFKAYHAALDRYVAIKVLHPAFTVDPSFLARFQREARVVARLDHPNIVPVYDYSEHAGAPYLVMKFIPGETLKARLARGPMAGSEVLRCIEAVGAALEFAHGQGVLHRDIKPSNIMLAGDGTIYLADFGLARMAQAGESTLSADTLLGTPSYMSPEQARGDKELDTGTDIYSFGVVVYELVVGRVPFSADTPYAVIHDHIFTPLPPPRRVNPKLPEAAETALLKALAKDRGQRYATVADMVVDLRRSLGPQAAAFAAGPAPGAAFAPYPTVVAAPEAITPAATSAAPTMAARLEAPAPTVAGPALAATETSAPVAAAARSPNRLQWWQIALGVVLLGVCFLLALGALSRAQHQAATATQTALAALPATAVVIAPTTASITAAAQQHLLAADRAFVAGQTENGLAQLDQAVAVDPSNTAVLLRAGDLALEHKLAVASLRRYYGPGVKLEVAAPDPRSADLRSHAALAFYVAAADQQAGSFLDAQVAQYPESFVPLIAQQRYKIFYSGGQGVLAQLSTTTTVKAQTALAGLVLGDYYLSRGQLIDADRNYTPVSLLRLANGSVPDWVIREARCDRDAIRTQPANAKVEASCVDLLSLLTGK